MSTPTPRTDAIYLEHRYWANEDEATEAIEDFRDLARTLEHELNESRNAERLARVQLGAEREKVRVLREAAVNVAMIGRVWLTVWYDKFTTETVHQFERAEGVLLATLATEETK